MGGGMSGRSSIQGLLALVSLSFDIISPFASLLSPNCHPNQNASLHNDSSYSNLVITTPRNIWKHLQNTSILSAETFVVHRIWKMKEKKVKF